MASANPWLTLLLLFYFLWPHPWNMNVPNLCCCCGNAGSFNPLGQVKDWTLASKLLQSVFFFFFFFNDCTCSLWKFRGKGSKWSCNCQPTPQPPQLWIWATSLTYTTVCGNARTLTHWAMPGMEPTSSRTACLVLNLLGKRNSLKHFSINKTQGLQRDFCT